MKKQSFLLVFLLSFSFSLVSFPGVVRAQGLIYIRSDGSVEGTDNIQRNGDVFTLIDDINGSIIIERNSTYIDGAGYTLQGNGMHVSGCGIQLLAQNSTIMNFQVKDYNTGIEAPYSYNNFLGNIIEGCYSGIHILGGSGNVIEYNIFRNNFHSISLVYSAGVNNITKNNFIVSDSYDAMWVWYGAEPIIDGNYWNKYSGDDADGDGIGDVPYVFREVNQDDYQDKNPLMLPVDITTIPEFSLCSILPLIGIIILVVSICRKKLTPSNNKTKMSFN